MPYIEEIPGGPTKRRELHFYWVLDTSGSMAQEGKIESLNEAIRQAAPVFREAASEAAEMDLRVHAIEFNDGARWVNADLATGVSGEKFEWTQNLRAEGQTSMGEALGMVAEEMKSLTKNAARPVICLVTDGQPSDSFTSGLKKLMEVRWGKYAFRHAIAIGEDADLNVCQQFIGTSEIKPMRPHSIADIKKAIKVVTMAVSTATAGGRDVRPDDFAQAALTGNASGSAPVATVAVPPPLPTPELVLPGGTSDDTWEDA